MASAHDPPPQYPSADEASGFERELLESLRDALPGWARGARGVIESVELRGSCPDTELVLAYSDYSGTSRTAVVRIWDPEWHEGMEGWESPGGLGGIVTSNWLDGSLVDETAN